MEDSKIKLANTLTYAGTLPFVVSLFTNLSGMNATDITSITNSYGAIILSFLCGIHWAASLFFSEKCPRNLFITSNIIALAAWFSLLLSYPFFTHALLILCFLYLLALDYSLMQAGILAKWFYELRRNATFIVVVCLLGS